MTVTQVRTTVSLDTWTLTCQVVFDFLDKLPGFVLLSLQGILIVIDLVLQFSGLVFGFLSCLFGRIDLTQNKHNNNNNIKMCLWPWLSVESHRNTNEVPSEKYCGQHALDRTSNLPCPLTPAV